jgi:hypothetical protein
MIGQTKHQRMHADGVVGFGEPNGHRRHSV